jgi:hypothetical protein
MAQPKQFDLVDYIIDFEQGDLSLEKTLELFSYLVKTGQAWTLQGFYGRTAQSLIDKGIIAKDGAILKTAQQLQEEELS